MKKLLFFALLAGIAVMTGCQKDQNDGTLKAVIDQDTKAYFGTTNQAYWDVNDQVYVNGNSYYFDEGTVSRTFATITGVTPNSVYCAVYPANIVENMGTPNASGTTATIYFDPHQLYIWENNRQRVNMPMGAATTSNTLYFRNLCSILRLTINRGLSNNDNTDSDFDFDVKRITIQAFGAYIAGSADVTLAATNSGTNVTNITMSGDLDDEDDNVLSFYAPGYASMGTFTENDPSKTFDIVVPPFDAEYIVIEVEMYEPNTNNIIKYSSNVYDNNGNGVHLDRNKIINITLGMNDDNVFNPDYGYLEKGEDFNAHMVELIGNNNVTNISFNTTYIPTFLPDEQYSQAQLDQLYDDEELDTRWILVQDPISPFKIYACLADVLNETTQQYEKHVMIYSRALLLYANTNCSTMFKDLTTLQTINWNTSPQHGFQTEDVTDMSYMFAGCRSLTSISGINDFNTTNVTTMAHMFEGCSAYSNLNLSGLNTHNLKNMEAMFEGCTGLGTLNLSSFTTERVTNMSELFRGCTGMKHLYINNFDMTNVTNKSNMCLGLGNTATFNIYSYERQNLCNIHCTLPTQTALRGSAPIWTTPESGTTINDEYYNTFIDPTTGLNTIKIAWPVQGN